MFNLKFLKKRSSPILSIILILYNMRREAPRTLFSLSARYQAGITENDYEVIVIDNGSKEPLSKSMVESFGRNFRYYYRDFNSVSPCAAVNWGAALARGEFIGIMIDGARILSPGVLRFAFKAFKTASDPVVATLAWHLGPDLQCRSVSNGYTEEEEDRLLADSGWEQNGYGLFDIASFAGSSLKGFFLPLPESNCFFMRKDTFEGMGGYDERFDSPGGGLANLDIYRRACELEPSTLIVILGEGTFHQMHGGVSTGITEEQQKRKWKEFADQYMQIRGEPFRKTSKSPEFIGHIPASARRFIKDSTTWLVEQANP